MKTFKQKDYTIQEGHYTGPKDMEEIPSTIEVLGKTTIGGSAAGALIGGILEKAGVEGTSIKEGALTGGKTGFLAGVAAKILLNSLHKPMEKVKFQEVDKLLRAKFGIYRVSGFTTGDTLAKRKSVEEKFSFNDRQVTSYKISFCIQNNQVTLYTLGLTDEDMDKLNSSLDYYCKKFSGMEYSGRVINARSNSYAVSITFTNYKAISDFIYEVSEVLGYKINLLDNSALLETAEKRFSVPLLDKYDLLKILTKTGGSVLGAAINGPKAAWSTFVCKLLGESLKKITTAERAKFLPGRPRKEFTNIYLEDALKRLGYIEGVHYTVGKEEAELNIRLDSGLFMICCLSSVSGPLEKLMSTADYKMSEIKGKVKLWTGLISDKHSFSILLEKIIGAGYKPNIYIG